MTIEKDVGSQSLSIWGFIFHVIVLISVILITLYILSSLSPEPPSCDYDSCTQESVRGLWNYSGPKCFNRSSSDCQEFLKFWDACQDYKKRIGAC